MHEKTILFVHGRGVAAALLSALGKIESVRVVTATDDKRLSGFGPLMPSPVDMIATPTVDAAASPWPPQRRKFPTPR